VREAPGTALKRFHARLSCQNLVYCIDKRPDVALELVADGMLELTQDQFDDCVWKAPREAIKYVWNLLDDEQKAYCSSREPDLVVAALSYEYSLDE